MMHRLGQNLSVISRHHAHRFMCSCSKMVSILDASDEEIKEIPHEDIRNFCFIAHVDHGKSSLASRVLELTGNLGKESMFKNGKEKINELDLLKVEQERGITVKATAASMLYKHDSAIGPSGNILLNMVDTPGHTDFSSEVQRSLSFVQGGIILFDSVRGVQAQSWNVYKTAKDLQVKLIPAVTKIDLENSRSLEIILSISNLFGFDPDDVLCTSARLCVGINELLNKVCEEVSSPCISNEKLFHAKIIDSWYEKQRGVICLIQILAGNLKEGDKITVLDASSNNYSVQELGLVLPFKRRIKYLPFGFMGYAVLGMHDPRQAKPGSSLVLVKDLNKITIKTTNNHLMKSNGHSAIYASVHPSFPDQFDELCAAIDRLALNDTGLDINRTQGSLQLGGGEYLGPGLRIGFQGLLHMEIFRQRLLDESGLEAIITPPKVPYTITFKDDNETLCVEDLNQWPKNLKRKFTVKEPTVSVRIIAPSKYVSKIMELILKKRGSSKLSKQLDDDQSIFEAIMPWSEVVTDFHDHLKSSTAGYASFDVLSQPLQQLQQADLSKVDIFINGQIIPPLAFVSHIDHIYHKSKLICQKLQQVLPRQQFVTIIQAKISTKNKIIASERIQAYRKDVLTKSGKTVGGGDKTRKQKLLQKQKKGKKRQQQTSEGKVFLSQEAFNAVISPSK